MIDDVLSANEAFYRAIREANMGEMETLWSRTRPVCCVHPGWAPITGRHAIVDSWRALLIEAEPPEIWPLGAHAVVMGPSAMVLCIERIGSVELMGCNGFVLEDGAWRITDHQAAPVPATPAD